MDHNTDISSLVQNIIIISSQLKLENKFSENLSNWLSSVSNNFGLCKMNTLGPILATTSHLAHTASIKLRNIQYTTGMSIFTINIGTGSVQMQSFNEFLRTTLNCIDTIHSTTPSQNKIVSQIAVDEISQALQITNNTHVLVIGENVDKLLPAVHGLNSCDTISYIIETLNSCPARWTLRTPLQVTISKPRVNITTQATHFELFHQMQIDLRKQARCIFSKFLLCPNHDSTQNVCVVGAPLNNITQITYYIFNIICSLHIEERSYQLNQEAEDFFNVEFDKWHKFTESTYRIHNGLCQLCNTYSIKLLRIGILLHNIEYAVDVVFKNLISLNESQIIAHCDLIKRNVRPNQFVIERSTLEKAKSLLDFFFKQHLLIYGYPANNEETLDFLIKKIIG